MKIPSLLGLIFLILLTACSMKKPVDYIFTDGIYHSIDSVNSTFEAIAVNNGKIVATGSKVELNKTYKPKTSISLKNKHIYPGFIDPHCHFLGYSLTLNQVDLRGCKSYQEMVDRCIEHHKSNPSEWITGRGWDETLWPNKTLPTKELLDQHFPNTPVLLRRIDGHAAVANSLALKKANINSSTSIEGGEIQLIDNIPTGLLIDNAADLVINIIPEYSNEEKARALLLGQNQCFAVGLTSVGDAGLLAKEVALIENMQNKQELQMKVYAMLTANSENLETYLKNGIKTSPYLSVRCIKLYADGALGSRGAKLLEPYSDQPESTGLIVNNIDSLRWWCSQAKTYGYQVATHCIGDSANRLMLKLYSEQLEPGNNLRWRIEHAQVVHPNDFGIFGQYKIVPSIQTTHCTSDMRWAEDRLGNARIKNAYAWRALLEQNQWIANGSDFPIESINPLYGFYSAITRQDHNQKPESGFYPEQKLTRIEALKAMTIWAAKAQFEEGLKGSLEVGKAADFVVLPTNILECPVQEIPTLKVDATYINGELVYGGQEAKY